MTAHLPPHLTARWGHLSNIRKRGYDEWSSYCPVCGGRGRDTDRFRIFDDGDKSRGWCRKCDHFEWLNEGDDYQPPSPAQIAEIKRAEIQRQKREKAVNDVRVRMLWKNAPWRQWHANMTEQARSLWRSQGIDDWDMEDYQLGYVPNLERWHRPSEKAVYVPALSIPYLWRNKNHVRSIQYRLIEPERYGLGKYWLRKDIITPLFLTQPLTPPEGRTLVVEGAKKAIVVNRLLHNEFDRIVAVVSATPNESQVAELALADSMVVMLDPDANNHAAALVDELKKRGKQARWVALPDKVDDMIINGASKTALMRHIKLAR